MPFAAVRLCSKMGLELTDFTPIITLGHSRWFAAIRATLVGKLGVD